MTQVNNKWSDEARRKSIEARRRKAGYKKWTPKRQDFVTKWEAANAPTKLKPKLRLYKNRLQEQSRQFANPTMRKLMSAAKAVGLKQYRGIKFSHSSWVDKKTGYRYDYASRDGLGLKAFTKKVPGIIIETAPDGTKRQLDGPQYNVFKRNCQMANKFLPMYIKKFNRMRRREMQSTNNVATPPSPVKKKKKKKGLGIGALAGGAAAIGGAALALGTRRGRSMIKGAYTKAQKKAGTYDASMKAANDRRKALGKPLQGELMMNRALMIINGGPGSGHHGHKGLPGTRGGSMPSGMSAAEYKAAKGSAKKGSADGRLSESPQARARRIKHAYTNSSRLADLYDEHVNTLEDSLKGAKNKNDLAKLIQGHLNAAKYMRESSQQATMVRGRSKEDQLARIKKAQSHEDRAAKLSKKLKRRVTAGETTKRFGRAFLEGMLGGSIEDAIARKIAGAGAATMDVAFETAKSAGKKGLGDIGKTVTDTKWVDKSDPEADLMGKASDAVKVPEHYKRGYTVGERLASMGRAAKKTAKSRTADHVRTAMGGRDLSQEEEIRIMKKGIDKIIQAREIAEQARKSAGIGIRGQPLSHSPRYDEIEAAIRMANSPNSFINSPEFQTHEAPNTFEAPTANFAPNATTRREQLHGREYLVAPLTMIVPGVLAGSKGPLLYPEEEVSKNTNAWNGMPIVVNHPTVNGTPVEARSPGILEKYQIGTVFNAKYNGKLVAEGWFDLDRTRKTNVGIYENLVNNKPIELSTGLYTNNQAATGTWKDGREYKFIARDYRPDHLAILLTSKGACSIKDGCGVLINGRYKEYARGIGIIGKQAAKDMVGSAGKTAVKHPIAATAAVGGGAAGGYVAGRLHGKSKKSRKDRRPTTNLSEKAKRRLKKVGGFGLGAAQGGGGAILGGTLGGALGTMTPLGPVGGAIGAIAGGAVGGAIGGRSARKNATRLMGKEAGKAADWGSLAGSFAAPAGVARVTGKVAGTGVKAAWKGTKGTAKALKAGKFSTAAHRGGRAAKLGGKAAGRETGRLALDATAFEGTDSLLRRRDRNKRAMQVQNFAGAVRRIGKAGARQTARNLALGGGAVAGGTGAVKLGDYRKKQLKKKRLSKKHLLTGNAWTDEARQKSLETRRRNRERRSGGGTATAVGTGGGVAGGLIVARVVGSKLDRATDPDVLKKGSKSLKQKIVESFEDPIDWHHDPVSGKNVPFEKDPGLGWKAKKAAEKSKAGRKALKLLRRLLRK